MTGFDVPDMTCGRCADRIHRALAQAGLPASLVVEIDVRARQVRLLQAGPATGERVRAAIEGAGYTTRALSAAAARQRPAGCCCGPRLGPRVDKGQAAAGAPSSCCG